MEKFFQTTIDAPCYALEESIDHLTVSVVIFVCVPTSLEKENREIYICIEMYWYMILMLLI